MNILIHIAWAQFGEVTCEIYFSGVIPRIKCVGTLNLYVCHQMDTDEVHTYSLSLSSPGQDIIKPCNFCQHDIYKQTRS